MSRKLINSAGDRHSLRIAHCAPVLPSAAVLVLLPPKVDVEVSASQPSPTVTISYPAFFSA
jgi:hypothetical protein